jgi:hypothetical protein
MLLLEKEPGFVAALELAMNLVDSELSGGRREACSPAEFRGRLGVLVSASWR